jgi:hydroxymethylglutaryl-CoA synthase
VLDSDPKLFEIELGRSASASAYRGVDFRKPFARHFVPGYHAGREPRDYPVFNGRYSTACYLDQVLHALDGLFEASDPPPLALFDEVEAVFFHRPYQHLPVQAFATALVRAMVRDERGRARLEELCGIAEVELGQVVDENEQSPDLFALLRDQGPKVDPAPATTAVVKALRRSEWFAAHQDRVLSLGARWVRELGNLYTASLPAWIAAGLEDAARRGDDLAGKRLLAIGYGSGDAAEALSLRVCPGWREAAAAIDMDAALADAVDLEREQYEQLHAGQDAHGIAAHPQRGFFIERHGAQDSPDFQDVGIEYYGFRG